MSVRRLTIVAPHEWFSPAELEKLALPGLPTTKRNIQSLANRERWATATDDDGRALCRPRAGRGGGLEYHASLLPDAARAALTTAANDAEAAPRADRESAWMRFDRLGSPAKAEAKRRLAAVQRVEALIQAGMTKGRAIGETAAEARRLARAEGGEPAFTCSTLYAWFGRIAGVAVADRVAYLAPSHAGRQTTAEIDAELWELYKADYLRPAKATHAACYGRLTRIAEARGLPLPSAKTLQRRLEREIPRQVAILKRLGQGDLDHSFPHMTRSRAALSPLEVINLDGHTWDVRVQWPDGEISRPLSLAVQDIFSGKVLAVRFDRTLNQHLVRLALADTFRDHGLPTRVLMDNGRENAARSISGGQTGRWRWKKLSEEGHSGLLTDLGIEALFATPYWGQAKPVERAFRDWAGELAKHPAFEGAYTGRNTVEKPANYGERAIPVAEFEAIVRREVAVLNARQGRRGLGMAGRSFDQVFAEGVERMPPKRATAEQLRMALAASKPLTLDGRENTITLIGGARFWSPQLGALKRQPVTVRFDPENLQAPVHVYDLGGRYLCDAQLVETGSFDNVHQAQAQRRRVKDYRKAAKALAAAEIKLDAAAVAAALPDFEPAPQPAPSSSTIVRPAFGVPSKPKDFSAAWARSARSASGGG